MEEQACVEMAVREKCLYLRDVTVLISVGQCWLSACVSYNFSWFGLRYERWLACHATILCRVITLLRAMHYNIQVMSALLVSGFSALTRHPNEGLYNCVRVQLVHGGVGRRL